MITFNIQDQVVGGGVAEEALGGEAPEVGPGVQLCGEADAASRHDHAAAGTQAELLQQLEADCCSGKTVHLGLPDKAPAALLTLLWRDPFW